MCAEASLIKWQKGFSFGKYFITVKIKQNLCLSLSLCISQTGTLCSIAEFLLGLFVSCVDVVLSCDSYRCVVDGVWEMLRLALNCTRLSDWWRVAEDEGRCVVQVNCYFIHVTDKLCVDTCSKSLKYCHKSWFDVGHKHTHVFSFSSHHYFCFLAALFDALWSHPLLLAQESVFTTLTDLTDADLAICWFFNVFLNINEPCES